MKKIQEFIKVKFQDIQCVLVCFFIALTLCTPYAAAEKPMISLSLDSQTAALLDAGQWEKALDRLILAYQKPDAYPGLGQGIAFCYQNIGEAALVKRRPAEAINAFDQGLRFARKNPDLLLGLGRAYMMASEYSHAEAVLLDVIALRPDDPAAHDHLGRLYYLTDNAESAVYHWEHALMSGGKDPKLADRLERLRRQLAASRNLETVADHQFSVQFDGEQNPELRDIALEMLGDAVFKIGQTLNIWPNRRIGVMLLTRTEFFDITGSPGWAAGIYEGQIKAPVAGYKPDLLKMILHHEYVHAALFDFLSNRCPWWLNEGLAQRFAPEPDGNQKKLALAEKILTNGSRPSLKHLPQLLAKDTQSVMVAYALALSATNHLIDSFGMFSLQTLLENLRDGMSLEAALFAAIGYSLEDFESEWIARVRQASR